MELYNRTAFLPPTTYRLPPLWRRTILSVAVISFLIALRIVSAAARLEHGGTVEVQRPLMGTMWNIEVVDHGRPDAAGAAIDLAYAELERIEALMSEWKPESPISAINSAAGKNFVAVPQELRAIIARSKYYGEMSEGTFDITWHGIAHIWHFDDAFRPPSEAAVQEARRSVNFRAIEIDGDRVFLPKPGMSIGLGGIAKGYAIDRASKILSRAGFGDSLVDGGGDVLVSGVREDGQPWRVGVQDPRQERGRMLGLVRSSNRAVATSGDYERFRIVNGIRYHHIIDPRTGWPANASISVTVMAETAERAVVLAKPIFILGPEKGMAFARAAGVEALIVDPQGRRFATDNFRTE